MVESLVVAALKAQTGAPPAYVTSAGARVYALVLPTGTLRPAITFQRISTAPVNSIQGSSGLDRVRLQVDCWADTYGAAKTLAAEVRPVMAAAGFQGLLESEQDDYEAETRLYRVSADYFLWQQ